MYSIIVFILSFSVSSVNINVRVLMQKLIPENMKGKVLGTLSSMCLSISPIVIVCGSFYIEKDLKDFCDKISNIENDDISRLPFRNYVVLEPTNDCSAHCIHCFHQCSTKYSWDKNNISFYIKLLRDNHIKSVSLTGGEIFSPHYIENAKFIIKELTKYDIKIATISTNGMFLSSELVEWLVANMDLANIVFRVSLDMVNDVSIFQFRPGYNNYYNKEYWRLLNDNNFNVVVTTVITNQQEADIIEIASFLAEQTCVKKWIVKPLVPTKKGHFNLINWKQLKKDYIAFLNWYKCNINKVEYDFILGNVIERKLLIAETPLNKYSPYEHPCKDEMFQKTIKASGMITRCPILPEIDEKYQVKDAKLEQSSEELFDNLTTDAMECKNCNFQVLCGGGCRAYALAFFNDMKKCDINSKFMFDWITKEKYFMISWPDYYRKVKEILGND